MAIKMIFSFLLEVLVFRHLHLIIFSIIFIFGISSSAFSKNYVSFSRSCKAEPYPKLRVKCINIFLSFNSFIKYLGPQCLSWVKIRLIGTISIVLNGYFFNWFLMSCHNQAKVPLCSSWLGLLCHPT